MVPGPIRTPRAEDLELEGEDGAQDVRPRWERFECVERGEEVLAFGAGLVEEPETSERGEADVPELHRYRAIVI